MVDLESSAGSLFSSWLALWGVVRARASRGPMQVPWNLTSTGVACCLRLASFRRPASPVLGACGILYSRCLNVLLSHDLLSLTRACTDGRFRAAAALRQGVRQGSADDQDRGSADTAAEDDGERASRLVA